MSDEEPTLEDELEPWEQQPNEGDRAYTAFCAYRALGPRRGLRQIARKVTRDGETVTIQQGEASLTHIAAWSKAWNWPARAHKYDVYLLELDRKTIEEERADALQRHLRTSRLIQDRAMRRLVGVEGDNPVLALDPGKLTAPEVLRYIEIGQKLERLALGEPDTIQQHQGPDGEPLGQKPKPTTPSDEELIENMQTLEDAGGLPEGTTAAIRLTLGIVDEDPEATAAG